MQFVRAFVLVVLVLNFMLVHFTDGLLSELLGQAYLHVTVIVCGLMIVDCYCTRRLRALLLGGLYVASLLPIWFSLQSSAVLPSSAPKISVLQANLWRENQSTMRILPAIKHYEPDIIVLQEVYAQDFEKLIEALPDYEHRYPALTAMPPQSMVVLSKYSFQAQQALSHQFEHSAYLLAIDSPEPILLAAVHLPSPRSSASVALRYRLLKQLGSRLTPSQKEGLPVLIIGDLNTTPWRPRLRNWLRNQGLRDGIAELGLYGSWPTWAPTWLRIPIDGIFLSGPIAAIKRTILPNVGSDHKPIFWKFEYGPAR